MKIVFFGTSDFAVPILKALMQHYNEALVAVVTTPDQPAGRHAILTPPPVKKLLEVRPLKVEILQPEKLKDVLLRLNELRPDLMIVASYGNIIPQSILDIPRLGCINVHPSLLPRHRGASPLQTSILEGDTETGVTIMKMDAAVDHGPILAKLTLEISRVNFQKLTLPELSKELSQLGAKMLIETLPDFIAGHIVPQEQDHSKATFTKMFNKEDGHMDFTKSAVELEHMVRALNPWPSTWTKILNPTLQTLKILKAKILHSTIDCAKDPRSGILWLTEQGELAVNANPGSLVLEEVQPEGKKPMSGIAFINGHKKFIGTILQ